MDSTFAIRGKDFVVVAADTGSAYSILKLQDDVDKIFEIDGNKLMGVSGEHAAWDHLGNWLQKNLHLQRIRNHNRPSTPHAAANFCRTELAGALRKAPYQVNVLMAGMNPITKEAELYWIDWLGTITPAKHAAHGYAANFATGLLDKDYKETLTIEEAKGLLKNCMQVVQRRFLLSQRRFLMKTVSANGIETEALDL